MYTLKNAIRKNLFESWQLKFNNYFNKLSFIWISSFANISYTSIKIIVVKVYQYYK